MASLPEELDPDETSSRDTSFDVSWNGLTEGISTGLNVNSSTEGPLVAPNSSSNKEVPLEEAKGLSGTGRKRKSFSG